MENKMDHDGRTRQANYSGVHSHRPPVMLRGDKHCQRHCMRPPYSGLAAALVGGALALVLRPVLTTSCRGAWGWTIQAACL